MHTPMDGQNWLGEKLEKHDDVDKIKESAYQYAHACYEVELDVVGITGHNFLNKDYLQYLYESFDKIKRQYGHKITLFPGFEFAANVGKGAHVICLFEPKTPEDNISSALTECGISYPPKDSGGVLKRSKKNLEEIINIVQTKYNGIVIVPHIFTDGLFDNENINEWLQQDEYKNDDLLAAEVPKKVKEMSKGFQNLFANNGKCIAAWKRKRPLGLLMSSDCKMLNEKDDDGNPKSNSIGYRYTWIKMSSPSIESLRQAFLDNESRIRLPESNKKSSPPSDDFNSSRIKSLTIKKVAFLTDQTINFSQNLNCLIGGRGSGKSSIIEYIRIVLDKTATLDEDTKKRFERIRNTLDKNNSEIVITLVKNSGSEYKLVWKNDEIQLISDDPNIDKNSVLNKIDLDIFSQQQINNLTDTKEIKGTNKKGNNLLKLIDNSINDTMIEIHNREEGLKLKIVETFSKLRDKKRRKEFIHNLDLEIKELTDSIKKRKGIQDEYNNYKALEKEKTELNNLFFSHKKLHDNLKNELNSMKNEVKKFENKDFPHYSELETIQSATNRAQETLFSTIEKALNEFDKNLQAIFRDYSISKTIKEEIKQAEEKFNQACLDTGLSLKEIEEINSINETLKKKNEQQKKLVDEYNLFVKNIEDVAILLEELYETWYREYQKRREITDLANQSATIKEKGKSMINVSLDYQQDFSSFQTIWNEFRPKDKRTKFGRSWDAIGENVFEKFLEQSSFLSPWILVNKVLRDELEIDSLNEFKSDFSEHINQNIEKWEKIQCCRIDDYLDIELFREDGQTAGTISGGQLSDGQRNTAALALLLSQDNGPIIIDQPEDELDSNFVFSQLIPVLRSKKENRQIIIATHNANIPVNGDAELVYALEVKNGQGILQAEGGLDRKEITQSILNIMEGSKEAFRKRREKYNF